MGKDKRIHTMYASHKYDKSVSLSYHAKTEKITKCKNSDTSHNVIFGCDEVILHEILAWGYIIPNSFLKQLLLLTRDNVLGNIPYKHV